MAIPAAAPATAAGARVRRGSEAAPAAPPWTPFHAALVLMLLTFVWRLQDLVPVLGRFKITALASLAALGLFLLTGAERVPRRLGHPLFRISLLILVLGVLSVPGGVWPGYSFRFLVQDHVKTVLFAVMLAAAVRAPRDVERFVAVHVIGAALYSATVLTRFEVQADGRLGGLIYYDANDLAMVLVCTVPMVVYLARPGAPAWGRLAALSVLGLFVVVIVQTGSRGGFLGLITVLGVLLARFRAVPAAHRLAAVAAVAAGLAAAGSAEFWTRLSTLLNPSEDYNWAGGHSGGRMEVWKRGVGYMLENPVTGVGASAFGVAEGTISPMAQAYETSGRGFKWSAAHNSFVQIGAELGIPGLLAFLALLYFALATTLRLGRAAAAGPRAPPPAHAALAQALTATLVGYVVCGFFLSQAYSAYLYSILALVVALDQVSRDPSPVSAPAPAGRRRPVGRGGLLIGTP